MSIFTELSFKILTTPIAQPRPKAARRGGFVSIYTPDNGVVAYKEEIKDAFKEALGASDIKLEDIFDRRVSLGAVFYMPRSSQMLSKKTGHDVDEFYHHEAKPDIDNLLKSVLDALNGVAWKDDSSVVRITAEKFYAPIMLGGKSGKKRVSSESSLELSIQYLA